MFQIYNEQITDLLDPSQKNLQVKLHKNVYDMKFMLVFESTK